jgi:hypothetical protein
MDRRPSAQLALGLPGGSGACWRGVPILAGPTLGPVNAGIGIFEARRETTRATTAEDPVARGGFARAELRPYQLGYCVAATEYGQALWSP